jgi:hypothetical protein
MSKYPEAATVLKQIYTELSHIENLAGCTPAEEGKSSEWTSTVNSVDNRTNFAKL